MMVAVHFHVTVSLERASYMATMVYVLLLPYVLVS